MANLTIPHKFAGLEPAVANEVNENFEAMKAYTIALQGELNAISEALSELDKKPVREVFAIYPSISSKTPTGAYPLWTGETITNARTIYPSFWQECIERKTSGAIKTVASNTEYDAVVEEYGQCGCFFIDELNGHVRLPMLNGYMSGSSLMSTGDVRFFEAGDAFSPDFSEVSSRSANKEYEATDDGFLFVYGFGISSVVVDGVTFPVGGRNYNYESRDGNFFTIKKGVTYKTPALSEGTYMFIKGTPKEKVLDYKVYMYMQVATNVGDISELDTAVIANLLNESLLELQAEYERLSLLLSSTVENEIKPLADLAQSSAEKSEQGAVQAVAAADRAQALVDSLGTPLSYKGRVDTFEQLPMIDNNDGDFYFVGAIEEPKKDEYIWIGTYWENVGATTDFGEIEKEVLAARDEAVASSEDAKNWAVADDGVLPDDERSSKSNANLATAILVAPPHTPVNMVSTPIGVVSKGEKGDTGAQGEKGSSGAAATIEVGSTTTLPSGSQATVTNVGTTSAAVFNFAIPRGADGSGGGSANWGSIGGTLSSQTDLQTALNNKVNTVAGKGLSTNDFTNAEKTKLEGLENYNDEEIRADITNIDIRVLTNTNQILTKQDKTEKIILTKAQTEGGYAFLDNKDYVVSEGVSTLVISSAIGSGSIRFAALSGFTLDVGSLKIVGEHTFEENKQYDIAYIDGWVYVSQGVAI